MVKKRHVLIIAAMGLMFACCSCGVTPAASHPPAPDAPFASTPSQEIVYPPLRNDGRTIRFVHYGVEKALSQNSVQTIFQDQNGFLWIGTQDGLDRFDGYNFEVFRPGPNDPNAISGRNISSIIQGKGGTLWVGTSHGLDRYEPTTGTFSHYLQGNHDPNNLTGNAVQALYQDPQGKIWVGTSSGLYRLDPANGEFTHISLPGGSSKDPTVFSITAFFVDSHGMLWIGSNEGLIAYDAKSQKFRVYQSGGIGSGIALNSIQSITGDDQNILWIGTSHGLIELDPSMAHPTLFIHTDLDPASLIDNDVLATYIDRAGELWIGTRGGLDRFNPQDQQFIHYQNDPVDPTSLSSDLVDSIFEDRGGVLWFGTLDGGLNKYDRSLDKFAYYHHITRDPQSLSSDVISSITPLSSGEIWIGTYREGLNLFEPADGQSEPFVHDPLNPDSLLSNEVTSTYVNRQGTLWVGTDEGLDRLDPGSSKFVHYTPDATSLYSIPSGPIYAIFQDRQSTYWIGTSRGVFQFDPANGRFSQFTASQNNAASLSDGAVRVIFQDNSGALWFGTDAQGLFRFDMNTRKLDQFKNDPGSASSFTDAPVLDIFQDSRGILWVATDGGGLNRYTAGKNTFTQYLQSDGLPSDVIYGILEDSNGNLWLSTDYGISRFDPVTGHFENFTMEDGLQGDQFDNSAFGVGIDGRMYFGGLHGLTVFDPEDIVKDQYVPPVVISGLSLGNDLSATPAQLPTVQNLVTISYPQNSFTFSFSALSYSKTDRNQYKYKLVGFDQDWQDAGIDNRATYTNLPGGKYTLRVIGSNGDGVWNAQGASIEIDVIPPFWQTWPFRGLLLVILLAIGTGVYDLTMRRITAQKNALERVVQERTSALKKQNQGLEALYWADDKMLRVFTLEQVMQTLVDVSVDILQADKSAVYMRKEPHGDYAVRVSRGFHNETMKSLHFSENDQIADLAVSKDQPFVVNDAANDRRWRMLPIAILELYQAENVRSLMYIPVIVAEKVVGILNVCSSKPDAFDEDRQRIFAFLVQRASLSIENTQLLQQTKQLAISEERSRLAQELHDSAKQKAFAALAQLGTAKHLARSADKHIETHLNEAENILADVIRDLTFLIQELYPRSLKEKGLVPSLQNYAVEWERRFGIHLHLTFEGEHDLPFAIEQVLYRVVLEGLSNIARHSRGTQADILLTFQEEMVILQIGDNGRGFDEKSIQGGLGLRLIRERIESVGGEVLIQSQPGAGTQLWFCVPFDPMET